MVLGSLASVCPLTLHIVGTGGLESRIESSYRPVVMVWCVQACAPMSQCTANPATPESPPGNYYYLVIARCQSQARESRFSDSRAGAWPNLTSSSHLSPLLLPDMCNDTILRRGSQGRVVSSRGASAHNQGSNAENAVGSVCFNCVLFPV